MSSENVRDRVRASLHGLQGVARVTLYGETPSNLEFNFKELSEAGYAIDLTLRKGKLKPSFDLAALAKEPTVRGQFVRDVLEEQMDPEKRDRILVMGLRALEGKQGLEAFS
jgi:hypothetical protein